ncbi:MAG: hypothetical protein M0P71_06755 [Melioribacteraceae bacterium]|nr:hypothetical protein [Melioribacteraceae bacterium]
MKNLSIILLLLLCSTKINSQSLAFNTDSEDAKVKSGTFNFQLSEKKNAGLAIAYSLLLPGMGELYADGYDTGIYFTVADGVFWGALAGLNIYGNWQKDNYKSFAQSDGGISNSGKDEDYYANISSYISIYEFNREKELNRQFNQVYDVKTHYWDWKTNNERRKYREMWSSSENAYNSIRFAVGALVLNRIVSAINAVRLVNKYNKGLEENLSWNISVGLVNDPNLPSGISLSFVKTF